MRWPRGISGFPAPQAGGNSIQAAILWACLAFAHGKGRFQHQDGLATRRSRFEPPRQPC